MLIPFRKTNIYRIILLVSTAFIFILLFTLTTTLVVHPSILRIDDFVEYWAAGKLNLEGGNPYDPIQLLPLQLSAGRSFEVPVMMWNPPWMLALVMPFGALSYPFSRTLWLFIFIGVVFISISLLWKVFLGRQHLIWIGWLVGFTFIPVLGTLFVGQTGLLLLLGVAGFLHFNRLGRDILAGVSLSLLMVKPHLLYLVALAALVWLIQERRWRILFGWIFPLTIGLAIAWFLNPSVLEQYIFAVRNYPPENFATPTIGGVLRQIFGFELFSLQFLPPVLGIVWLISIWIRNRFMWDWSSQAPLIVLVSLLTSAYGWGTDLSIALVAIISVFAILTRTPWKPISLIIVIGFLAINNSYIAIQMNQVAHFWEIPAILVWYLVSIRILKQNSNIALIKYQET